MKISDKELEELHILFMRLYDKAQAGNLGVDGVCYDTLERMLKKIIKETNERKAAS